MKMALKTGFTSITCMALLIIGQAQASIVQFSINGEITSAISGNVFGLSVGETISASGQFDDSLLTIDETEPNVSFIDFSSTSNNMQINFGNTTYTDSMDVYNGAQMFFYNGLFDGIIYESIDSSFDSWGYANQGFQDDFNAFYDIEALTSEAGGYWLVDSYAITSVPLPAAVWLFTTGLLSFGVFSRRKHTL